MTACHSLLTLLVLACAPAQREVHSIEPGPHARRDLQLALIRALPGDVIELAAGIYALDTELMATTAGLTIRGAGPDRTRLSFREQKSGNKGLEVTGDAFLIEDLAIEDTRGNALKIVGARGVTVRRVRVEWTRGPHRENGAYGIYPVQCEDVLVEDCVAIGASDAGIYVGQSHDVVVRRCRAERNVVGVEIENCIGADVHDCIARGNTGGILVVDLPELDVTNGRNVRVFRNEIAGNNLDNFAPPGALVATVPPGTGVMVMSTDHVEIFENRIRDHRTSNLSVLSILITERLYADPGYDPYPEGIHIHDNVFGESGRDPAGRIGALLRPVLSPFPDIFWDGIVDRAKLVDGELPPSLGLRLERNGDATFANVNFPLLTPDRLAAGTAPIERDVTPFNGSLDPLPPVEVERHPPPARTSAAAPLFYRRAPSRLSAWGLFEGNGASQRPVDGVIPYDLNTELFADHAGKRRFVRLPRGASAEYSESAVFEFPAGTVIAKTFTAPPDDEDRSRPERLIESRILVREESGWYGLPYLWNEEQTEATLALEGGEVPLEWTHGDGRRWSNGYLVPNANQCASCHEIDGALEPLGIKARNINKSFRYAGGEENQLVHWARAGVLHGAPPSDRAPRVPRLEDPSSGSVEARARAWLDVNCAHCHSPLGPARSAGLDLRLEQKNPRKLGVWKSPVAAGHGSGGLLHGIVPGRPDESILVYRIASTEPGVMMPELPRRLVPEEGLAVVREWIRGMDDPLER